MAFALLCATSCKDGTTPVPITNLVPPDEPDLVDMSLTIGGATVVVSKHGAVSGQIVLRPGSNSVKATFLRAGDVPDPHVNANEFRLIITLHNYSGTVFVPDAADPLSAPGAPLTGTLTIPGPGDFTIRVVLNHVTRGHDDWNTDIARVFVRG
jgi:hypothetical protein